MKTVLIVPGVSSASPPRLNVSVLPCVPAMAVSVDGLAALPLMNTVAPVMAVADAMGQSCAVTCVGMFPKMKFKIGPSNGKKPEAYTGL